MSKEMQSKCLWEEFVNTRPCVLMTGRTKRYSKHLSAEPIQHHNHVVSQDVAHAVGEEGFFDPESLMYDLYIEATRMKPVHLPHTGKRHQEKSLREDRDGLPQILPGTGLRKSALKTGQSTFVKPQSQKKPSKPSSSRKKVFMLFPFKSGEGDEDLTSALNMPGGQAGIYLQQAASGSL